MVSRTMWAEALDEDEPLAIEGLPSVAGTGLRIEPDPVAATAVPLARPAEAETSDDARRRSRRLAGGLLALVGLALLLLLGWWATSQDDDAVAAGAGTRPGTQQSAVADPSAGDGSGVVGDLRAAAGAGMPRAGGVLADGGGTSDSSGVLRQATEGRTGGTAASAAGSGDGGTAGSGAGAANSALVSAKVGVPAGAGVDVSTPASGGAVATVVITSCVKPRALSTALDAHATVTWANGYQATDVKLTGLNLADLAHPAGLTVAPSGAPVAVPAGAKVQVGLCLGL